MKHFFKIKGFRLKLLIGNISILLFLGFTAILFVRTLFEKHLLDEFQKRNLATLKHLAAQLTDPLLTGDQITAQLYILELQEIDKNIDYIFITDEKKEILAHTFKEGFPFGLKEANLLSNNAEHQSIALLLGKKIIHDTAMPVLKSEIGIVHIGFSIEYVLAKIRGLVWNVIYTMLLFIFLSILVSIVISYYISRPITHLTQAVRNISEGRLEQSIEIREKDEIGELGEAFNLMLHNLKKSKIDLEKAAQTLEERVKERTQELENSKRAALNMMEDAQQARIQSEKASQQLFKEMEERQQVEQQLLQAQKLEGIGRLAGGVAHDFNNQLTAIMGYSQLLLEQLPSEDPNRNEIEEILKAAKRSANLTHQLLAFSRRQMIEPKEVNLNNMILNIEPLFRRLIGEHIELVILLGENIGWVYIDPSQLETVLVNLVVNARDAMPEKGKLIIETKNVTFDATYIKTHVGVTEGDYVLLAVSDTGIGIPKEIQKHIFEPFYTTKAEGKGTGLGLATCYGIVQQNRGYIEVYSEPGEGSSFKIYLPKIEKQKRIETQPKNKEEIPRGSETLLVVEDEASVRKVAVAILKRQGYQVLEAMNGEEALRVMEKQGASIDLLLSDLVMPRMGGKELIEKITPLFPKLKLLLTSGYTDQAIIEKGVLEKGLAFIQKPYTVASLALKVREVLDK